MLWRVGRDTAWVCVVFIVMAVVWRPGQWRIPLGVAGGGALTALSLWAIRGAVDGWMRGWVGARMGGGGGARRSRLVLVNFFTRHAMLALAAYVMMARLHLDPLGMLVGVSALGVAAGVEAVRGVKTPKADRR